MIKKITLGLIIVISVIVIFAGANILLDKDCLALSTFDSSSVEGFFRALQIFGLLFLLLIAGFVIYFKYLERKKVNILLYFVILSMIVSYRGIIGIYQELVDKDSDIKAIICEKATDDGMFCKMKDLSYTEYLFVSKDSWLPSVPKSSKDISIEYYRDDFLGDYNLIIITWISDKSDELKNSTDWKKTGVVLNGYIKYEYQSGKS